MKHKLTVVLSRGAHEYEIRVPEIGAIGKVVRVGPGPEENQDVWVIRFLGKAWRRTIAREVLADTLALHVHKWLHHTLRYLAMEGQDPPEHEGDE